MELGGYHTACIVLKFLDRLSYRFQVIWLPPYCPELNDIEHIWKAPKARRQPTQMMVLPIVFTNQLTKNLQKNLALDATRRLWLALQMMAKSLQIQFRGNTVTF